MVGIDGTAQGKMKIAATHLTHERLLIKKPESPRATIIFKLTATTKKTTVTTPTPEVKACVSILIIFLT